MRRRGITVKVATTILVVSMMSTNAMAATLPHGNPHGLSANEVMPIWDDTSDISLDINTDGTNVLMTVTISGADNTQGITGNAYLEKYTAGKWTRVKTWRISGKGKVRMAKTYRGKEGVEYRLHVVAKVGTEQVEEFTGSVEI